MPSMATPPQSVELPLTLRISAGAKEALTRRAEAEGTDLAGYVSSIVERCAAGGFSLEEISGGVYQRFLDSGTTDDDLAADLERGKHELRGERRRARMAVTKAMHRAGRATKLSPRS